MAVIKPQLLHTPGQPTTTVGIIPPPEPHDVKVIADTLRDAAGVLTALSLSLRAHSVTLTAVANRQWGEAQEWFATVADKMAQMYTDSSDK